MKPKNIKVIIDTNVWISFLIGKKVYLLKDLIINEQIKIVYCEQLLIEIKEVTSRPNIKKYFPKEAVAELLDLLELIGARYEIKPIHFINRDPKDNFLLDLIDISKAEYLITGDNDLLLHNPFLTASIITPSIFESTFNTTG